MNKAHWYYLPINPEPWAIGPLSVARGKNGYFPKVGPNAKLVGLQREVKEWFEDVDHVNFGDQRVELKMFFWRQLEEYKSPGGRKQTTHVADSTNMQKGFEDALQGVLFDNDQQVKHIESTIVAQGFEVVGGMSVCINLSSQDYTLELPGHILKERWAKEFALNKGPDLSSNVWPPPAGM